MYGDKGRIGLIRPGVTPSTEMDFHQCLPEGMALSTCALPYQKVTLDGLSAMADQVCRYAEMYRGFPFDLLVFACTTGSMVGGPGFDKRLVAQMEAASGIPSVTTSTALLEAFERLSVRKLSIVTPYSDALNRLEADYLSAEGYETVQIRGLSIEDVTVLPFVESEAYFRLAMEQTVEQLRKHPCICYWTIFNEGWGQFDSQREYEFLKTLDDTRFVDTASGWFRWGDSDVESLHIYFHPIRLLKSQRPQVLSEFGGYVYKVQDHSFNRNKTYGYKLFDRQENFMDALERLYREGVLEAKKKGLSAAIYTQLSDVEDETNGLVTYDRKICKVDEKRMNLLARALMEE